MSRRWVRRARAAARLASAPRSNLVYLGWAGHGNVGDDAILAGQRVLRGDSPLPSLPVHDMAGSLRWASAVRPSLRRADVLLGGGTLLGRPEWLARLESARRSSPRARVFVWGAGVEDPAFQGARSHVTSESLADWARVLGGAEPVGVRGPRSQEILADLGVGSAVVGDPALMLEPSDSTVPVEPGSVAVNFAATEDSYAGADAEWRSTVLDDILRPGRTVDLFVMDPQDAARAQALRDRYGDAIRSVQSINDPHRLVDWLATREVVISERLHGSVLAAAAGRPFVSLDYRPKCADFAASVGMQTFNLKVSAVQPGVVAQCLADLEGTAGRAVADAMHDKVRGLRQTLAKAAYRDL